MLVSGGHVLDVATGELHEHDVLAVDGRIVEVGTDVRAPDGAEVIDAAGLVIMPGLIDAHVHVTAATADLSAISTWPVSYVTAHAQPSCATCCTGASPPYASLAARTSGWRGRSGKACWPDRGSSFCGKALSQTGGHGDRRARPTATEAAGTRRPRARRRRRGRGPPGRPRRTAQRRPPPQDHGLRRRGLADRPDRLHPVLRRGAHRAVEEAAAANRYVAAHAYTPGPINRALRPGSAASSTATSRRRELALFASTTPSWSRHW